MQTNFNTIKTIRKHSKQETSEKAVKQGYKGKTWQRGMDKRNFSFDSLKGV
jgi:hypothetical protein